MVFTAVEWIALILIVVGLVKILVLAINPKYWMNFAKKIWAKPKTMQVIALLLAMIVLFYLTDAGITIVQILAISLFVALFMAVALAPEIEDLIKKYQSRIKRGNLFKQYWLYVLVWLILLLWGLQELFLV